MEYQIWRQLIQILSYRKDLIDTIKPFIQQLNNSATNEQFKINEEKYIPFLKSLSKIQIEVLHEAEIIDEEKYAFIMPNKELLSINSPESLKSKIVREIIKGDKLEAMQNLIREKSIDSISPILKSFKEVEKMRIPIIIECIIQKAIRCFKFLLITGVEDPTKSMIEQNPDSQNRYWKSEHRYEWDCMSIAIYCGEVEIVKILEEKGIEKGDNPRDIEAAILSYRNSYVKEIINQMNEKDEKMSNQILMIGIIASAKNNNIKGAELFINNGANVNTKDSFCQDLEIKIIYKCERKFNH